MRRAFQQRLWDMFHLGGFGHLSLPQLDRIRWHLFPEIRLPARQIGLFDEVEEAEAPDLLRVLDLQQEQLARSLGEGHRVIHGVAGSGKTLILGYRAEHLARTCAKPILVLCYNKALARRLEHWMHAKGVSDKVHIASFHAWCHRQLTVYHVGLPHGDPGDPGYWGAMVQRVIEGVDRHLIPAGQYDAVLIDEGHDFRPEWLKLVVRMVDPLTDSLLVLYDDAQSIYDTGRRRDFSFRERGHPRPGPHHHPQGELPQHPGNPGLRRRFRPGTAARRRCRRRRRAAPGAGFRRPPRRRAEPGEAAQPARRRGLAGGPAQGRPSQRRTPGATWPCSTATTSPVGKTVRTELRLAGIPLTWKKDVTFAESQDTVKLLPFHSSKGLEYPIVVIPGAGLLPTPADASQDEARLLYVAMTRATAQLIVTGRRCDV
jgi:hypothetical protein